MEALLHLAGASASAFVLAAWHALEPLAEAAAEGPEALSRARRRRRELVAALAAVGRALQAAEQGLELTSTDLATLQRYRLAVTRLQELAVALAARLGERAEAAPRVPWDQARSAARAAVDAVLGPPA